MFRRWTYFYVKMLPWMNWSKGTLVGGRFDLRYLSIDQVKRNPNRVFIKWSPQPLPLTSPRLFFPFTPHCDEMQLEYKTFWEETSYNHGEKLPFCPLFKITFSWHLKYWAHLYFLNIWGILHPYFGRQLSGTNLDDEYLLKSHIVDIWIFISWKILKKSASFLFKMHLLSFIAKNSWN